VLSAASQSWRTQATPKRRGVQAEEREFELAGNIVKEQGKSSGMGNAEKQVVVLVESVMSGMVAGERHSLHEIARRVNAAVPNVQKVLAECVATGSVNRTFAGKRHVYWLAAEGEAVAAGRIVPPLWSQATLQGYDAEHRRFRALCMTARSAVLQGLNLKPAAESADTDHSP
jgi:hypothetical protein